MKLFSRKAFGVMLLGIAACAGGAPGWAQQGPDEPVTGQASAAPPFWPARFQRGGVEFTVYPPQLERWEGERLEGRAAVAVQAAGAEAQVFGVVFLSARTEADAVSAMVRVHDFTVSSGSFPTAPESVGAYLDAVHRHLAGLTWRVALARLQADLAIDQASGRTQSEPLRNRAPRIVYVQSPTILVPIDGEPVLREVGPDLLRVVNTRALILQDRLTGHYFLNVAGHWLEAPVLEGRWAQAQVRPLALEEAKQKAVAEDSVDLLEDEQPASSRAPGVIVSTGPTELVQTDGPPQYAPVGHGDLLFVTNSPSRLFLDTRTQAHYVLLAGRWYRTSSLARGTWIYVAGADLPADFALIPDNHATASVRAAVPGTAQAQESVIANSVPQIATVKRSAARLEIAYDGAPQFRPIPGTSLEAAANAPVPVIRVEGRTYYALDNGVWFFSESAEGPWIAATSVPPAIYTIPRSHPLHYVTYVRVYDAEGDDVYVGYTPGYVGSYATPESTVVYGTGWDYTPWVGTVWYAAPVTWGFGFSFYYSWWNPWPWRASWPAWRPVPCFRPAWGPWPHAHVGVKTSTVAIVAPARWHGARIHGRGAFHDSPAVAGGIYRRWDSRSVPNVSSHRFSARGDTRPSFRGVDRGALSGPPHSPERDGRAPWRERNQWSGERQRSHVDPPRWARPDGRRDRTSSWDRTVQSFDPSPRRMQPPGAAPARTPPGADQPRSPGLWRGAVPSHRHGGAIEPRAHAPDRTRAAEGRQRGRQDDRGWARRDSAWPRGSLDAAPASPRSMQQQPFRPAAAGPRAADRMREFRAAPRQRAAQPSTGGPRVSGPALSR